VLLLVGSGARGELEGGRETLLRVEHLVQQSMGGLAAASDRGDGDGAHGERLVRPEVSDDVPEGHVRIWAEVERHGRHGVAVLQPGQGWLLPRRAPGLAFPQQAATPRTISLRSNTCHPAILTQCVKSPRLGG